MSLQVWLSLNKEGNFLNQGLVDVIVTNSGATYNTNGKIGGCYTFGDGTSSNQYKGISINTNFSLIGESRSICAWVRPKGNHLHYSGAIVSSGDWNSNCWGFCLKWDNTGFTGFDSGYSDYYYTNIPVNNWTHLCVTVLNGITKFYKNGEYLGETSRGSGSVSSNASNTMIGRETYAGGYFSFNGDISDVRIYSHALSPKEVHEIAKGLVLHYPMNDEYAESTVNIIGSDTCGSLSNGTWGGHTYTSVKYTITSSDPVPFTECQKHILTYSGSGNGGSSTYLVSVPVKGNTTYCYSRYIKASDNLTYTSANFLYRYEYANSTYVTEAGVFSNSRKKYIGNGWYRCWGVFTTRSETTSLNLHFFTYPNKNVEYLLGGILLEEKDHMTPYTPTTRNELVYDCSGYCNNGIVKELKASTTNLVTSLSSGGQTTVSGNKIITSGQNADTYFTINLSESIVKNLMYTLSCIGENIPTNGKFGFPLGKLSNTSLYFWIKNGYNEFTFVANDIDWGSKILFMDDAGRDTAYMNLCIFKDFKLYKHEVLNSGLNMISESPRYNKSCKFNGAHDIRLSNPFGERTMDELTIVFWHKPNVNSSGYKSICSNEYPHSGFWISANCEGSPLWWYGGGFYCSGTGITISNDIWYHIAITFKNNIYQWYLNGNPIPTTTSGTFKAPIFTNILSIGGNSSGDLLRSSSDYRLNGCLSDFRIYSTALSEDDIKELYNTSAWIANNGTIATYELNEE